MRAPDPRAHSAAIGAGPQPRRMSAPPQFRPRCRTIAAGILAAGLALTSAFPPAPRLVWNASSSAPRGLYTVSPGASIRAGDMVVARLTPAWEDFAAARRYLAAHVPLVKRIAAGPGDRVCAQGGKIFRNGVFLAGRLGRDRGGRTMPWWSGCLRLRPGQFLLLMAGNPASFDGRYFGITSQQYVIGRATLLWAR